MTETILICPECNQDFIDVRIHKAIGSDNLCVGVPIQYVPASTVSELVEAVKPLLRRLNDDENYNGDIFKEQLESELAAFERKKS